MSGASIDPSDFSPGAWGSASTRAEIEHWLQTMESLLADVADDPELAEPLARIIARTRARHDEAAERTKQTLSSVESLLRSARRLDAERSGAAANDKPKPSRPSAR
jgi:uncharacterized membrane protein YccC